MWKVLGPISGGCALTAAVMYPLDVVRALRMAAASDAGSKSAASLVRGFVQTHGAMGLLRQGALPEVLRATWMRCVQFFFFPLLHEAMFGKSVKQGTTGTRAAAGVLATVPSCLSITPLENAKIALQLDKQRQFGNSISVVLRHLYSNGGIAVCFAGWQGVQIRQAAWFAPYISTVGPLTRWCEHGAGVVSGATAAATLGTVGGGFAAGSLGALCNTPWDVVRTNLQKEAITRVQRAPLPWTTAVDIAFGMRNYVRVGSQIWLDKGLRGMYHGFAAKALHLGGSGACLALFIPLFQQLMGVERDAM